MRLPHLTRRRRKKTGLSFALAAMFAPADTGFALDFTKADALFQDQAGTQADDPGESVGFILDQSKALVLGPELIPNGGFDTDTGWTQGTGWTISNGEAQFSGGGSVNLSFSAGIQQGQWYEVKFTITSITSGAFRAQVGATSFGTSRSAVGTYTERVIGGTSVNLSISSFGATAGAVDNVSLREIPGRHAIQTNTALRPMLGRAPISRRNGLVSYSQELEQAAWSKTLVTVERVALASPLGDASASRLTAQAGSTISVTRTNMLPVAAGEPFVGSVYVKAETSDTALVAFGAASAGSSRVQGTFRFSTQVWSSTPTPAGTGYTVLGYGIEDVGGGWFRVWIAATTSLSESIGVRLNPQGSVSGTAVGGESIYAWGVQIERGSTPTAYQRVGASTADMIEPVIGGPAQRNLLTRTEEFSVSSVWTILINPIHGVTDANGGTSAVRVTSDAVDQTVLRHANYRIGGTADYANSIYIRRVSGTGVILLSTSRNTQTDITSQVTSSWTRVSTVVSNSLGVGGNGYFSLRLNTIGDSVEVCFPQAEQASTATAYEKVGAYWEPAHAVPAISFLRPDYVDDTLVMNLTSSIANGAFIIAGRNGCAVYNRIMGSGDTNISLTSGAVFNGINGLLRACGDLVGLFQISRTLSAAEKAQVLKYYQQRGAGGELVEGEELVTNGTFDTDTGWTPGAGWTISGGAAVFAGGADASLSQAGVPLTQGSSYVLRATMVSRVDGTVNFRLGDSGVNDASLTAVGSLASAVQLGTSEALAGMLLRAAASTGGLSVDNVSVKPLTPLPLVA